MLKQLTLIFFLSCLLSHEILADLNLERVIDRTLEYSDSPAYQSVYQSYISGKRSVERTLSGYDIISNLNYNYSQSESGDTSSTYTSKADSLQVNASKKTLLPLGGVLDLSAAATKTNPLQGANDQSDLVSLALSYQIPLTRYQYLGNTLILKNAARNLLLIELSFRDNKNNLLISNISEYFSFLESLNNYRLSRKSFQQYKDLLEMSQYKLKLGKESPVNVFKQELQLLTNEKSQIEHKNSIVEFLNKINEKLGLEESFTETLPLDKLNIENFTLQPFDAYFELFKKKSAFMANYLIQEQQIEESYQLGFDRTNLSLQLNGNYSEQKDGLAKEFTPDWSWQVFGSFSFNVPIYDKSEYFDRLVIEENYRDNKLNLKNSLTTKRTELLNTYENIKTLIMTDTMNDKLLTIAKKTLDIAALKYKSGLISYTDYESSVESYDSSVRHVYSNKFALFTTVLQFYNEIGIMDDYIKKKEYYEFF